FYVSAGVDSVDCNDGESLVFQFRVKLLKQLKLCATGRTREVPEVYERRFLALRRRLELQQVSFRRWQREVRSTVSDREHFRFCARVEPCSCRWFEPEVTRAQTSRC